MMPHGSRQPWRFPAGGFLFYVGMNQYPALIDEKALAIALGISVRTVSSLMSAKRIPAIRITSKLVRFDLREVRAALV